MADKRWSEAVEIAIHRLVARNGNTDFSRRQLIDDELTRIIDETGSRGATPEMTLSRELQDLRDRGKLEFTAPGQYKILSTEIQLPSTLPKKCVFVTGAHSIYDDQPDRFYRFPSRLLRAASQSVGQWTLYQEPRRAGQRGYFAAAKVEQIIRDPATQDMFLALIQPGSFLEFGRDVPFKFNGKVVERGLLLPDGRVSGGRAVQSIRSISEEDFNRIIDLGVIDDAELLPRDDLKLEITDGKFEETHEPWLGPVDRSTILVERKVRDRQFRKRVLDAYDRTCALTGMQLINGGGRAEAQAAHVMSVEAGGPDSVVNGIALSGTVHWMFDRGLISLSDSGEILISQKINDIESAHKLIHSDRRARLPLDQVERPHPRYLAWHREYHQFAA